MAIIGKIERMPVGAELLAIFIDGDRHPLQFPYERIEVTPGRAFTFMHVNALSRSNYRAEITIAYGTEVEWSLSCSD